MALIDDEIKKACDVMAKGGVILYPTDTIWGIGCDATNSAAVERLFALKQRADSKAMLMLLDSSAKLPYYIENIPEAAWMLLDSCEGEDEDGTSARHILYQRGTERVTRALAESRDHNRLRARLSLKVDRIRELFVLGVAPDCRKNELRAFICFYIHLFSKSCFALQRRTASSCLPPI